MASRLSDQGGAGRFADRPLRNRLTGDYLAGPAGATGALLRSALTANPHLASYYGDRFLSRPVLLDAAETARLGTDLDGLFRLLSALPDRLTGGDLAAYGRLLGLSGEYVDTVLRAGTDRPGMLGRADLYHDGSGFRVLEYNLSSAVGGMDGTDIAHTALRVPAIGEFASANELSFMDTQAAVLGLLLDRAGPGVPTVAVMDWPTSFRRTAPALWYLASMLSELGMPAVACHAGQAQWRDGALTVHGRQIDVVYRLFTLEEMLAGPEPADTALPVLRAVEAGAVELFLPFDTELYSNKAALALLSDPRTGALRSEAERALVDRVLPWTRSLDGRSPAELADLLGQARARQADLVCKPALGHGGHGVLAGWAVSEQRWADALLAAVGAGYVVQERVRAIPEPFTDDGRTAPWLVKWGVFAVSGGYAGTLAQATRQLDAGVVNRVAADGVTAALHAVPTGP